MNNAYLKSLDWAFSKIFDDPNIDKEFKDAVKTKEQEAEEIRQHERNLTNAMAQEVADK